MFASKLFNFVLSSRNFLWVHEQWILLDTKVYKIGGTLSKKKKRTGFVQLMNSDFSWKGGPVLKKSLLPTPKIGWDLLLRKVCLILSLSPPPHTHHKKKCCLMNFYWRNYWNYFTICMLHPHTPFTKTPFLEGKTWVFQMDALP